MFADLEHDKNIRRLDAIRNLDWWWKIPINISLFIIFIFYGSVEIESERAHKPDDVTTF